MAHWSTPFVFRWLGTLARFLKLCHLCLMSRMLMLSESLLLASVARLSIGGAQQSREETCEASQRLSPWLEGGLTASHNRQRTLGGKCALLFNRFFSQTYKRDSFRLYGVKVFYEVSRCKSQLFSRKRSPCEVTSQVNYESIT